MEHACPDIVGMWDFEDPSGSEARFRGAASAAGDDERTRLELMTQVARALGLQRRFDEAHAILDEMEHTLHATGPVVRTRYLLERGRALNSGGDAARALGLFDEAWMVAREAGLDGLAVDAAHMAAIAAAGEAADAWHERAMELAESSEDPDARRWRASLLNNIGWAHHDRGDFEHALRCFEEAEALRREEGDAHRHRVARWCVGRGLRSVGRVEEALRAQREIYDPETDHGYEAEEIGECLLALGQASEARPFFAEAHAKLSADAGLAAREPERIARLARLGGV